MRASTVIRWLVALLATAVFPGDSLAQDANGLSTSLKSGFSSNIRSLLVVDSKSVPVQGTAASSPSTDSKYKTGNPASGTTSVSVGENLVVLDDKAQPKNDQNSKVKHQQAAKPQLAGGKQRHTTAARKKGRKQAALGRKGAGNASQLRQADYQTDYGAFPDDYILPDCRPGLGVICADNDNLGLLKALPAEINLDDAYPFFEVKPSAGFTGETTTTADLGADTYTTDTNAKTSGELGVLAGRQQVTGKTDTTTTIDKTTVDASRIDRVIPDSVSTSVDSTAAEGTYEWKTLHPKFTYVAGQNYGFPVGLAPVKDGITG